MFVPAVSTWRFNCASPEAPVVVVGCPWHCSIVPAMPPQIERMATLMSWLFRVLSNTRQLRLLEVLNEWNDCLHPWSSTCRVCDGGRVNVCVGWPRHSHGLRGEKDSADDV